jgi:hypothetical protein
MSNIFVCSICIDARYLFMLQLHIYIHIYIYNITAYVIYLLICSIILQCATLETNLDTEGCSQVNMLQIKECHKQLSYIATYVS